MSHFEIYSIPLSYSVILFSHLSDHYPKFGKKLSEYNIHLTSHVGSFLRHCCK
jgi:hypothetical protein